MGTGIEELWKTKRDEVRVADVHTDSDHKTTSSDDLCQVVLYNDNHNSMDYVVSCLMSIFKHSEPMAKKLMLEAHRLGRTIAQVEECPKAIRHAKQLSSKGLKAEVESL